MCNPIAIGIATAAAGGMQAIGQHQAQKAAVARSNAIAQQQYQRELQIAAQRDRVKNEKAKADFKADAAAKTAYYAKLSATQAEANRALASSAQTKKEVGTTVDFNTQRAMRKAIQAQGSILATGGTGQSHLLRVMDAERELGIEMAEAEQTLYDAELARGIRDEGTLLDAASANIAAWNGLPASPLNPQASLLPVKPIKAKGPSNLSLLGSLVGAGVSGVSAGYDFKASTATSLDKPTTPKTPG